jgi:hypothetical protein
MTTFYKQQQIYKFTNLLKLKDRRLVGLLNTALVGSTPADQLTN